MLFQTHGLEIKQILNDFHKYADAFVKVMPLEYKRILEERKLFAKADLGEYTDG